MATIALTTSLALTTSPTLVSAASLPRFIALQSVYGLAGSYLVVKVQQGIPYLTFTDQMKSRLVAHEVLYNADESGVAMLRAPNGCFWQCDSLVYIVADRETIPSSPTSDPACYFKLFRNATGHLLFQSMLDGKYLKWINQSLYFVPFTFHASASGITDLDAAIRDTSAVDDAVVLPRYIMFLGDNNM